MKDQSLPSKKFEPKYKEKGKRMLFVTQWIWAMATMDLWALSQDGWTARKKRYRKEIPGTKSITDKKQLKGLQMSLLNL